MHGIAAGPRFTGGKRGSDAHGAARLGDSLLAAKSAPGLHLPRPVLALGSRVSPEPLVRNSTLEGLPPPTGCTMLSQTQGSRRLLGHREYRPANRLRGWPGAPVALPPRTGLRRGLSDRCSDK